MKAKLPSLYTREYFVERLSFLDMVVLMVLHNEFGFGAERLKRFYAAIMPTSDRYKVYLSNQEPSWGKKDKSGHERMDLWAVKRDLAQIGIDYDELSRVEEAMLTMPGKTKK